jgi:hypothetical protein
MVLTVSIFADFVKSEKNREKKIECFLQEKLAVLFKEPVESPCSALNFAQIAEFINRMCDKSL